MSQENVEIASEAFSRFQDGDPGWTEWIHPEIEWDFSAYPLADLPTKGRGRDRMLNDVMATYYGGWVDLRQEMRDIVDAGDDVVVDIYETARLRDSATVIERTVSHVLTVRDELWVRWRIFETRGEALEAVGLRE